VKKNIFRIIVGICLLFSLSFNCFAQNIAKIEVNKFEDLVNNSKIKFGQDMYIYDITIDNKYYCSMIPEMSQKGIDNLKEVIKNNTGKTYNIEPSYYGPATPVKLNNGYILHRFSCRITN